MDTPTRFIHWVYTMTFDFSPSTFLEHTTPLLVSEVLVLRSPRQYDLVFNHVLKLSSVKLT